ncbi:MAG: hypothetical protein HY473_00105 [Candidatus Sungbacteria bacterium]|uniref:Uncharacterized protein n=1 Tax=Candidatus Sungiibacteriota bacterium TaxID=2750080 RepID=A0A932YYE8_9BACT|nr:hypothetical protein [Candidatus Sungbacteria bacterium]
MIKPRTFLLIVGALLLGSQIPFLPFFLRDNGTKIFAGFHWLEFLLGICTGLIFTALTIIYVWLYEESRFTQEIKRDKKQVRLPLSRKVINLEEYRKRKPDEPR